MRRDDGAGRGQRGKAASANCLAQGLRRFGFTPEQAQGGEVSVGRARGRRVIVGVAEQGGAGLQRLGQMAGGRLGSGFGHGTLRLG